MPEVHPIRHEAWVTRLSWPWTETQNRGRSTTDRTSLGGNKYFPAYAHRKNKMNIEGHQSSASTSQDLIPSRYGINSARIATVHVMVR
jgi:hypothetical protein